MYINSLKKGNNKINMEVTKLHDEGRVSCRSKEIRQYIQAKYPVIERKYNIKSKGVTFVCNPKEIKLQNAWESVLENLEVITERLLGEEDVLFILSTIEIHEGKKQSKKGQETMTEGEEKPKKGRKKIKKEVIEEEKQEDEEKTKKGKGRKKIKKEVIEEKKQEDEEEEGEEGDDGESKTLLGYPHIHIAIGFTNWKGDFKTDEWIYNILYDLKIYTDIMVGSPKKGKGGNRKLDFDNIGSLVPYILKNARHNPVHSALTSLRELGFGNGKEMVDKGVCINLYSKVEDITKFFEEMPKKKDYPIEIINDEEGIERTKMLITAQEVKDARSKLTIKQGDGKNELQWAIDYVKTKMEQYDFATFDGKIYEKVEGSKQTYILKHSVEEFFGRLLKYEVSAKLIKHKGNLMAIMNEKYQDTFPNIHIDYLWIEFKDCYFFLPECVVVKEQKNICFNYCGDITYDEIINNKESIRPTKFLEILENSSLDNNKTFLTQLYKTYIPRVPKEPCIYIVGKPQSGKTTIIDTIKAIYPDDKIATMSNCGSFTIASLNGKLLVLMDELQGWKETDINLLLKLLEGDTTQTGNVKYKDPTTMNLKLRFICGSMNDRLGFGNELVTIQEPMFNTAAIMVEQNPLIRDEITIEALKNRLTKYDMRSMLNPDPSAKTKVILEKYKVMIYLARNYKQMYELTEEKYLEVLLSNYYYDHPELKPVLKLL